MLVNPEKIRNKKVTISQQEENKIKEMNHNYKIIESNIKKYKKNLNIKIRIFT